MGKRYYWLKLKEDFFTSKRIKKLKSIAGGDTYIIIYLKMQLLALKNDGVITFTHLEDDFAKELALDIDEQEDNVRFVLNYLQNVDLIETSDNVNFFLPYVIENTGSETADAQRMREFRANKSVTKLQNCNNVTTMFENCYGEKEIEKEKDKELDKEKDKEEKETVESILSTLPDDLQEIVREYVAYRKEKKNSFKVLGFKKFLTHLNNLSGGDIETCKKILDQTMANGWQGIFPLKEEKAKSNYDAEMEAWAND